MSAVAILRRGVPVCPDQHEDFSGLVGGGTGLDGTIA
jgi:hypothetical protein